MHVLSVNTGLPELLEWQGKSISTSIFKRPVAGPVRVEAEHLAGDGQADLRAHGGPDKAVYAYPHEHYTYWQAFLPPAHLEMGTFGENLTTSGLLENQVRVGDCYQFGTAVLRAMQPRRPCFKLGIRLQDERIVQRFEHARRPGIYFRIEQEGVLQAGDAIVLLQPSAYPVTIQDMIDQHTPGLQNPQKLRALLDTPYLSASWRERFTRLLAETNSLQAS